jgi:hypothetical protein
MELRQLSFRKSEIFRRSISWRVLSAALASVLLALPAAAADDKPQAGFDPQRLAIALKTPAGVDECNGDVTPVESPQSDERNLFRRHLAQ